MASNEVVGGEDVGLLGDEELADGQGQGLFEGVGVGFFGGVFALLGGDEQGVVAVGELGFEVAPDAVEGTGGGAGLFDVADAGVVEFGFEVAVEAGALEGFSEEVVFECLILKVLAEVGEALLAILEGVDDFFEHCDYFVVIDRFRHSVGAFPVQVLLRSTGCEPLRLGPVGAGSAD